MNSSLLAYLVALGNLQSLQTSEGPIKNLAVKFGDLHSLKSDLRSMPEFNVDKFRDSGYYRVGDIGKYLSRNLRDYIYQGRGQPSDEGVILTIYYGEPYITKQDDSSLSLLFHKESIGDDAKTRLENYFDHKHPNRQRRSLVDILKV
ncbi:unnamed protein product [Diatraea saccharalis]|uniref:Uncharacterized protein n=1 Tax=Diatraea saccharalis TaxID=40085 RepID=A0A9N9WJ40_9NEOP|nr:unnamed protein product [Diatraea saccharalis]